MNVSLPIEKSEFKKFLYFKQFPLMTNLIYKRKTVDCPKRK